MNWTTTLGRLLGYDNVSNVESAQLSLAAAWANSSPASVVLGCGILTALSFWFYLKWQMHGRRPIRVGLAILRAMSLCVVLLILTDPTLELTLVSIPKPVLWILLD